MKYNDRKNTPLKWHWFLKIVLPLILLYEGSVFVEMILELFDVRDSTISLSMITVMKAMGYSIHDMGGFFWPVLGDLLFHLIIVLFFLFAVWGLWTWKKYGPRLVSLIFFVNFLKHVWEFYCVMTLTDLVNVLTSEFAKNTNFSGEMLTNIVIAYCIFLCVSMFVLFLLNVIYYHKRKILFDEYYVQPTNMQAGAVVAQSEVTVQAVLHDEEKNPSVQSSEVKEERKEDNEPSKNIKVSDAEEIHSEDLPKTNVCPNCHQPVDTNAIFCGNCGTKLK